MIMVEDEIRRFDFYKKHKGDKIWHVRYIGLLGTHAVSVRRLSQEFHQGGKGIVRQREPLLGKKIW